MLRAGLPELTAFVAIAHERSFSAAARTLDVSPSALSHAMRGLEAKLGVAPNELWFRLKNGNPNDPGLQFSK